MGKRITLLVLCALLVGSAAWAQDAGDRPADRPADGGGRGGFFGTADPETLREQAMLEVQVWHKFLSLSDEQTEQVVQLIVENLTEMIAKFRGAQGGRPTPEAMEEIALNKALAIFDVLSDEQKGVMNYYYNDILAEIAESQQTRFQERGLPGGGRPPQSP